MQALLSYNFRFETGKVLFGDNRACVFGRTASVVRHFLHRKLFTEGFIMYNKKLIQYVKSIYKMESSLFMMDNLYEELSEKAEEYRNYDGESIYDYESKPTFDDISGYFVGVPVLAFAVLGLIFRIFAGWIFTTPSESIHVLFYLISIALNFIVDAFFCILIGAVIGLVIGIILFLLIYLFNVKQWKKSKLDTNKVNKSIIEQNQKDIAVFQNKAKLLDEQVEIIGEKYNETCDLLDSYYKLGIIHPKYRNFIAISSIYEYLTTGRCKQLQGHGEAYDTFEYETRLNRIITQLDDIIERLDEIRDTQYQLFNAVQNGFKQSNALLNDAIKGIDRLESSQKINNYYSEISARNSEYFRLKDFYNSINSH